MKIFNSKKFPDYNYQLSKKGRIGNKLHQSAYWSFVGFNYLGEQGYYLYLLENQVNKQNYIFFLLSFRKLTVKH